MTADISTSTADSRSSAQIRAQLLTLLAQMVQYMLAPPDDGALIEGLLSALRSADKREMVMGPLVGFHGDGEAGTSALSFHQKRDAVFTAVRQADHRYDGAAPDSQGVTRPEYVGRAAIAALYADN